MSDKTNGEVSIAWPITLLGFPISIVAFILIQLIFGNIEEGRYIYLTVMGSAFLFCVFSAFNIIFSVYTIYTFWKNINKPKKIKGITMCFIGTSFSAYLISKLWMKSSVNIYSLKNKNKLSLIAFSLYSLILMCVIFSYFLTNLRYP